jgi:hypothetical protein
MAARERTILRVGLAVAAACTTATGLYALLRITQLFVSQEPDPALVIWSEHAGFFWRSLTACYVAGMVAFGVWLLAETRAREIARWLAPAIFVAAALATAQGLLAP